jgi:hypothetical protein
MKNQLKYSIVAMITLLALATVNSVFAMPFIGQSVQVEAYEANPQANAYSGIGTPSSAILMYDGDIFTAGNFLLGSGFGSTGYFELKTFTNTPPGGQFNIEWVDLKIKYQVPSGQDDPFRFEYAVGASAWTALTPDLTLNDQVMDPPNVRPWSGIAEPNDGVWDWTDIGDLKVRVWCGPRVGGWNGKRMYISEVWASVYSSPPETGSTVVSMMPGMVLGVREGMNPMPPPDWDVGFVDLYITDVVNMTGYEVSINFDTTMLTPTTEWFTYYPFVTQVLSPVFDDSAGYVTLVQYTYFGDPEGFTGDTPFARIYFQVDKAGWSRLTYGVDKITDPLGGVIAHTTYDGTFSASQVLTGIVGPGDTTPMYVDPTAPIGTWWHELYPTFCIEREIVSWTDNGDWYLSASDQITMDEGGVLKDYHVDDMRLTIHWTFKPPEPEEPGAGEPWELIYDLPPDPTGTIWHQSYPVYCRYFEISSWTDNEPDGVFGPSDQFLITYYDDFTTAECHLDSISLDILVSEKPPPDGIPEFPLGFSFLMLLAPIVPFAYLWRLRKKVTKQ